MPLIPLLWVRKLYKDATPLVKHLTINPIDIDALEDIKGINNKIKSKGGKEALKQVIKIEEISNQINIAWQSASNYNLKRFWAAKAVLNNLKFLNYHFQTYDCPKAP